MIHPYILHDQGQQILGNHESLTKRNYWEIYRTLTVFWFGELLLAESHCCRKRKTPHPKKRTSLSEGSFRAKDCWSGELFCLSRIRGVFFDGRILNPRNKNPTKQFIQKNIQQDLLNGSLNLGI